jgi:predicted nucleotidyltransferase
VRTKTKTDFLEVLRVLIKHEVDFIVVGGVSAVLQGAPVNTFDLDLVHSRDSENIVRLLRALDSLDAIYRAQPDRRIKTSAAHLSSLGHQLLLTRFGPLDLLGTIGSGRGYEELLAHAVEMKLDDNLRIRVLDLETLIQTKEEIAGEKDNAVLPILRQTLKEKSRLGPN